MISVTVSSRHVDQLAIALSVLVDWRVVFCRVPVPARTDSEKVEAKGIFPGAMVIRSVEDWVRSNQDGQLTISFVLLVFKKNSFDLKLPSSVIMYWYIKECVLDNSCCLLTYLPKLYLLHHLRYMYVVEGGMGTLGTVLEDVKVASESCGKVRVLWDSDVRAEHQCGKDGKVDLRCFEPANGGNYYRDHLARLSEKLVLSHTADASAEPEGDSSAPEIYSSFRQPGDLLSKCFSSNLNFFL